MNREDITRNRNWDYMTQAMDLMPEADMAGQLVLRKGEGGVGVGRGSMMEALRTQEGILLEMALRRATSV